MILGSKHLQTLKVFDIYTGPLVTGPLVTIVMTIFPTVFGGL